MGDRLDDLLGELACGSGAAAPMDVESEVWGRIDRGQAAASRLRSGVKLQCAIGACALLVGFSYQVSQGAPTVADDPAPSAKLLDGSRVAEAGAFQVLR